MIDLAQADAPAARRRRTSRGIWIGVVLAAVVIVAGVITAVVASRHYRDAPGLTTDGGGWLPPDNAHLRSVRAGQYSASVAPPRPGHQQTFEMDLYNPSSVSQTVLGLTDGATLGNAELSGEPSHLAISTTPSDPSGAVLKYSSKSVVIPPHREFRLRYTIDTRRQWAPCQSEYWGGLSLQVRVGVFTRTEYLDFDRLIMELREPGPDC